MSEPPAQLPAVIRNEFAMVEISLVPSASGPVLQVTDLVRRSSTTFDAMELEGLACLTPERRAQLLDPGWRSGTSDGD